jgi:hypothetical protein
LLRQLRIFAGAAARPHPASPLYFWGRQVFLKKNTCSAGVGAWTVLRRRGRSWFCLGRIKILPRISVQRIPMSVRPSVRLYSGKWLVEPSSTRNRAISFFISLSDTGRCYGVSLCRADTSGQRRVRCWLQFFGVTGRNSPCHRIEHVGALLPLKLSRCM